MALNLPNEIFVRFVSWQRFRLVISILHLSPSHLICNIFGAWLFLSVTSSYGLLLYYNYIVFLFFIVVTLVELNWIDSRRRRKSGTMFIEHGHRSCIGEAHNRTRLSDMPATLLRRWRSSARQRNPGRSKRRPPSMGGAERRRRISGFHRNVTKTTTRKLQRPFSRGGPKRGNPTMTSSTVTARRKGDPQH